ncbi:hypothetical protein OEW28_08845 [Defluviimonas sp. WL0002]|uniref:Uncharacterized protein n=1 Tax=Albidovulum marisflavi TaxID=2984159 RepID=A0ABT2ZCI7_9RHOB|nr:hypothetical protein [Defluviimonas sp. WL0002]MCV2868732.1 hypothetical protein [Defluviimonas sp. WL0002]
MKTLFTYLGRSLFLPSFEASDSGSPYDDDPDPCLGIDCKMEQALLACFHSEGARQYLDYVCRCRE